MQVEQPQRVQQDLDAQQNRDAKQWQIDHKMHVVDAQTGVMGAKLAQTKEIIADARLRSNTAIVFYSTGKDSIALLDMVAPLFDRVFVVYMYFVKDLEHINIYLDFSKRKYSNIEIIQVPHWILTSITKEGIYCAPNPQQRILSLKDIDTFIRAKTKCGLSFYGMKKSDGMNRRLMLNTYRNNSICDSTCKYYPLSEWSNKEVLSYIRIMRLPIPISYTKKKSNGLTFDRDVFMFLKENYPSDLQKIYTQFPKSKIILNDR